jgi:hypothetical protein
MKAHTVWFLYRWRDRVARLVDPAFAVGLGAVCSYGIAAYLGR